MQTTINQIDLKNIETYKNKKIINTLKKVSDEEINDVIDSSIIDFISTLDYNTINLIFRNSGAILQEKLWSNDVIQRILILGTTNIDNFVCDEKAIRNIENLNKVIKSKTIKKEMYKNEYFLTIVMFGDKFKKRFFRIYDINKVFEGIISSVKFNSLAVDKQLRIIEKLNEYTREILLPTDFRKKYNNIERILFESDVKKIDESILLQLNDEELFFLDYISTDIDGTNFLKKYLIDNIKNKDRTFEDFFVDVRNRDELIRNRICVHYKCPYYYNRSASLKEKIYHILLHENDDEIIKEKLLKYLICCIMKGSSFNPEMIYNTLKRNLNNGLLSYKDVNYLMNDDDIVTKDLKLIFYHRFNVVLPNARYLHGISLDQLSKVNVKHVNKLFKFLEDKTQDELSSIYGICLKMYFIFGYERSIEILSGKFGEYNKTFLDNVAKTDVSRVEMKAEGNKYLPVIDKRFINFMFETSKNNHFINMFNNKSSKLYKRWYYLYNNYDEILDKCHNEITLKKVTAILETEKFDINRRKITPDNYLLNDDSFIENIILGNKTHNDNNYVLETIIDIYTKMKKRVESSIPYVEGISTNGYKYQMLKLDDPQIFELGYKADCCIRTLDVAHNHLLHAALCRNGRILLIYDKLGDLAAFCPLKRNGNVLISNSIECVDKEISSSGHFIADSFSEAMEEIVKVSKKSAEPIELVCIGRNSYLKPKVVPFPIEYETPTIFEKDNEIYRSTDRYHKTLDIVYKDSKFSLENIRSKNPEVSYMDPRDEVKYVDLYEERDNNEAPIDLINSINYSVSSENYVPINKYSVKGVYYSKDWYIADTYRGIIGECLDVDYRAKEEFDFCMNMLSKGEQQKVFKKEL